MSGNLDLIEQILAAAYEVYLHLGGPGLLENVYEFALCHELALRKILYQRQVPVPFSIKEHRFALHFSLIFLWKIKL